MCFIKFILMFDWRIKSVCCVHFISFKILQFTLFTNWSIFFTTWFFWTIIPRVLNFLCKPFRMIIIAALVFRPHLHLFPFLFNPTSSLSGYIVLLINCRPIFFKLTWSLNIFNKFLHCHPYIHKQILFNIIFSILICNFEFNVFF